VWGRGSVDSVDGIGRDREFSLETENLHLVEIKRAAAEVMKMIEETKEDVVKKKQS